MADTTATLYDTLRDVSDLLSLVAMVLEPPLAEDVTVDFPAARYVAGLCDDASATLLELMSDLDREQATTPDRAAPTPTVPASPPGSCEDIGILFHRLPRDTQDVLARLLRRLTRHLPTPEG